MTVSIKKHFSHFSSQEAIELDRVMKAIRTDLAAAKTTLADYKAIYDVHVHTADGNASRTSVPDSGTPTGSASAASAFTDSSTANLVA